MNAHRIAEGWHACGICPGCNEPSALHLVHAGREPGDAIPGLAAHLKRLRSLDHAGRWVCSECWHRPRGRRFHQEEEAS